MSDKKKFRALRTIAQHFVDTHWDELFEFAHGAYVEYGRGIVGLGVTEGTAQGKKAWLLADEFGFASLDDLGEVFVEPYLSRTLEMASGYDPENQIVFMLDTGDVGPAVAKIFSRDAHRRRVGASSN